MATFITRPNGTLAQVRLKGAPSQSKTWPTKAQAKVWAAGVEAELLANQGKVQHIKTLADAMDRFKAEVSISPERKGGRWECIRIDKLKRDLSFVGKLVDKVDVTDISAWRDLSLKTLAPSSVNREMNLLSAVFTHAMRDWGWCKSNPVRSTKRPKNPEHRDRLTSHEEKQIMLNALGYIEGAAPKTIGQKVAYAYLLALETAMREGELCSINKTTLFIKERYIHLENTKNGKKRNVSLSERAAKLLSYFPDGLGITPRQIDANWRKARAATKGKVVNLHFHDSCHQAITDLARKLNVMELSRMTGRSIKTLMIYFNATATDIAKRLD